MFRSIEKEFGTLDVLINNAGISYVGLLTDMTPSDWKMVMDTNLSSVFYCCSKAIPMMLKKKSGRIINISSMWGTSGASCEVAYSATKAGVHGLTKALAKELAPSNIQVNAIACGVIDTTMNGHLSDEDKLILKNEIPAGRFGTPDEVGELAVQLAETPSYLTGQIIGFDGGFI
jgi:3-oxoacyl-[acyl-carrier protein] reductase